MIGEKKAYQAFDRIASREALKERVKKDEYRACR
jgi:hypothetical protein